MSAIFNGGKTTVKFTGKTHTTAQGRQKRHQDSWNKNVKGSERKRREGPYPNPKSSRERNLWERLSRNQGAANRPKGPRQSEPNLCKTRGLTRWIQRAQRLRSENSGKASVYRAIAAFRGRKKTGKGKGQEPIPAFETPSLKENDPVRERRSFLDK